MSHENFEVYNEEQKALMHKWAPALEKADLPSIKTDHMAITTAVLLENYMRYLHENPQLIAEDEIQSGNFRGVNLALLGLIRRAIPEMPGLELVGTQAMPTPTSPIFHLLWKKGMTDSDGASVSKGSSSPGSEWFGYGADNVAVTQEDPYFTSFQVRVETVDTADWDTTSGGTDQLNQPIRWRPLVNSSFVVIVKDQNGDEIERYHCSGNYASASTVTLVYQNTAKVTAGQIVGATSQVDAGGATYDMVNGTYTLDASVTAYTVEVQYEYLQESNLASPEITMDITQSNVKLLRRMLRGKFSLDAETDANSLWGLSLESEMLEMMRLALQNDITREIIRDLRNMAAISTTVDFSTIVAAGGGASGNYDDAQRYLLDVINGVCAEIFNQGRLGYGNWVLANPATLTILERVPGFVGSGVNQDSKGLSFTGSLGGRIKFYRDPQFPKNEILVGYKGVSALDAGYIHAMYLPITATPTMLDPNTGDRRRIFWTRYGKTWYDIDPDNTGLSKQHILRGEFNYARIKLQNFPSLV